MKYIRRFLILILILASILILVGLFLPSHMKVKRDILIKASPILVFDQINTLKNWQFWSPWHSNTNLMFSENTEGKGARLKWKSNSSENVNGEFIITGSFEFDSLHILMDFGESGKSSSRFIVSKQNKNTKVTWIMESNLTKNPISRWFGLFSDHLIGPDLEKGLYNLNKHILTNVNLHSYKTEIVNSRKQIVISITDSCLPASYNESFEKMVETLSTFINKRKLKMLGLPMAIFHNYNTDFFKVEVAIPINRLTKGAKDITCYEMDSCLQIKTVHLGNYRYSSSAYDALYKEIELQNLEIIGPPCEVYVNNPGSELDTINWQTNIFIPIRYKKP